MPNLNTNLFILAFFVALTTACNSQPKGEEGKKESSSKVRLSPEFKDYWYAGEAELSHFKLKQGRYGQKNPGEAILIFVTEDFLTDKQVKHEKGPSKNATKILKLNKIKRFQTGLYDYSMMMSVFTPVHRGKYPHSLKVTTSSQDWCGHAYLQMNNRDGEYHWQGFSYFQDEVHEDYKTERAWLEDEVWTRLRLAPESLPTGSVKMVPGTLFKRLRHRKLKPEKAEIKQKAYEGNQFKGKKLMAYRIHYPEIPRTLTIVYEKAFPYRIQGWIDKHESGFGEDSRQLKTIAVRDKTLKTDYWNKNNLGDSSIRKEFGVSDFPR